MKKHRTWQWPRGGGGRGRGREGGGGGRGGGGGLGGGGGDGGGRKGGIPGVPLYPFFAQSLEPVLSGTDKSHPVPHCSLMPHYLKCVPRQDICWCGKISRNILKIWQDRGKELLLSMYVRVSNNLFIDKRFLSSLQNLAGTGSG